MKLLISWVGSPTKQGHRITRDPASEHKPKIFSHKPKIFLTISRMGVYIFLEFQRSS
jgi:hypothetical protein